MTAGPTRQPTAVDAIAEDYFDMSVALSPLDATFMGIPGYDELIDDLSPAGYAAAASLRADTLAQLATATPTDDVDRVTIAAMRERLGLAQEMYDAGLDEMAVNVIVSPLQNVRAVFDLMPTNNDAEWSTFGTRLAAVPTAMEQWVETLRRAADKGDVASRRQVDACATQCVELVAADGYFANLARDVAASDTMSDRVRAHVGAGIAAASASYARLGEQLRTDLLAKAPDADAVGRDRYALYSRYFLGTAVDLDETYEWGQEEVASLEEQRTQIARSVLLGASAQEVVDLFDANPDFQLHGTEALQAWMQRKADDAIDLLADTHFDIPGPVRTLEGCIAPTQTGGIYYTGPSDDFSRPGRMWWSVPKGVTEFTTWRELTTVYHEGVPGHHLQVAQTVYRKDILNKWRRLAAWTAGHGEGWALYAERLMAELGYMNDPANRLGWIDGQTLRAARVVVDIGVHCGLPAPAEVGGGDWTYDKAWDYLRTHTSMEDKALRFELDRYLGWPGQAPAYKIGERLWLDLRAQVKAREGDDFDLKAFHRRALDLGGLGLDTLREAVLAE